MGIQQKPPRENVTNFQIHIQGKVHIYYSDRFLF